MHPGQFGSLFSSADILTKQKAWPRVHALGESACNFNRSQAGARCLLTQILKKVEYIERTWCGA